MASPRSANRTRTRIERPRRTPRLFAAARDCHVDRGRRGAGSSSEPSNALEVTDAVHAAHTLDAWGDREGALAILRNRVKGEPEDAAARILLGTMLMWEQRYPDAREELTTVYRADPKNGDALAVLVHVELEAGMPARARELATEGLAWMPDRRELLLVDRARADLMLGQLGEARADLEYTLALHPDDEEALALRRRVAAAIDAHDRLLRFAPIGDDASVRERVMAFLGAWRMALVLGSLEDAPPEKNAHAVSNADILSSARALAGRKDRATALELLAWHLVGKPDDTDARTLYGTILSWDGQYEEARRELARVLHDVPAHSDAVRAAIHVELWSDHADEAERMTSEALSRDPGSVDLLIDRARARYARGNLASALKDLDAVLLLEPSNVDARRLRAGIEAAGRVWAVGGTYTFDAFSDGTPWHEAILQGRRSTPLGAVFVRAYEAWRFGTNDNQFELEAFPRIRDGTCADVGAAFSPNDRLYPSYRVQIDLYQSFPLGFDASAGYRHLQFGSSGIRHDRIVGFDWQVSGRLVLPFARLHHPRPLRHECLGLRFCTSLFRRCGDVHRRSVWVRVVERGRVQRERHRASQLKQLHHRSRDGGSPTPNRSWGRHVSAKARRRERICRIFGNYEVSASIGYRF